MSSWAGFDMSSRRHLASMFLTSAVTSTALIIITAPVAFGESTEVDREAQSASDSEPALESEPEGEDDDGDDDGDEDEDEDENEDDEPPDPNRFELAPFPSLGGNTDIGFQFGVNVAVARLSEGYTPFRYRIQVVAELSVKRRPRDEGGLELPMHNYKFLIDLPGLAGGRLRVIPEIGFERVVNAGYFGLTGLSNDDPLGRLALSEIEEGRRYQFIRQQPVASLDLRWRIRQLPIELLFGGEFRYVLPNAYSDSLLAIDAGSHSWPDGSRVIVGFDNHALVELRAGVMWDRRDHEIAPTRGSFVELSARGGVGAPQTQEVFGFGGVTADVRLFVPLVSDQRLVLASRFLVDMLFGEPPYYELSQMGTFDRQGFCSSSGIRGSPEGRHSGELKMLAVLELRSLFLPFRLFRMPMVFGLEAFVAAGQVWGTLRSGPPFGDSVTAASFGAGGGLLLRWGEAVMVRIEFAYSPDATDAGMPVGIYFNLGYAF